MLVWLAAMALFFRKHILSGFDQGFSDRADGIIEVAILEHWRNVWSGAAAWNVTGYFHPYPGTLGYNDGYFLYGLSYTFWRLFADPLLADTLNLATFKSIGFFAAYMLVARTLRWGRGAALFVAFVFTDANGLMIQAGHAQLQSVALLPVAMLLAVAVVRAGSVRAACVASAALGLLMAAWLFTAFYMAWFTIFFGCVMAGCWLVTSGNWRPRRAMRLFARHHRTVEAGALPFLIALVPFFAVYLPKMRETGGQALNEIYYYLLFPIDAINVGASNYVWGWLIRSFPSVLLTGEHVTGFPLLMFALGVTALWRCVARGSPPLRAFALAVILCWLLTLRVGEYSGWALVYHLVPGAKGLRVVARFQLFLILPLLLVVVAAHHARAAHWARTRPLLLAGVVLFLVAEQIGSDVPVALSRSRDGAALAAVPAPPRECQSFYVVTARRHEPVYVDAARHGMYPHNVDAMLLAQFWRVPTLNGYSTFTPRDWVFANPRAGDYDARVAAYAVRHGLSHVCRLDMEQPQPWTRVL
ncbi:hypothetical protein [Sphingomonas immobilis]|uniref:Glycosyltransferase RgtA/B/C/D-like domain-containing protein n=1 Tax=Sphingomonas immobilis TaxID=3063997 RepID=A0ABT8ZUD7_9SPHN|nr:hypothetical protein [Sphingomonas sp. CA1-15]MDO7840739.1 hypothetical protein [Sphingomonas sp. CA1-15]